MRSRSEIERGEGHRVAVYDRKPPKDSKSRRREQQQELELELDRIRRDYIKYEQRCSVHRLLMGLELYYVMLVNLSIYRSTDLLCG